MLGNWIEAISIYESFFRCVVVCAPAFLPFFSSAFVAILIEHTHTHIGALKWSHAQSDADQKPLNNIAGHVRVLDIYTCTAGPCMGIMLAICLHI